MWREEEQLRFDDHQFARKAKAVSATKTADDWESPGLSFQDFGGMHVVHKKQSQVRKLPTPDWALNDNLLRQVVLRFAEDRFFIKDHTGTDQERMARIDAEAKRRLPEKQKQLESMLQLYHQYEREKNPATKTLAVQLQNVDTEIVLTRRGIVALATAVIYRYYRQNYKSVRLAEEFGLKSPMVRIWLRRLHTTANRIFGGPRLTDTDYKKTPYIPGPCTAVAAWDKTKLQTLRTLRVGGATFAQCGEMLDEREAIVRRAWQYHFPQVPCGRPKRWRDKTTRKFRWWTPERIAQLRQLREVERKTFQECADAMGLKRCQAAQQAWKQYIK
ncbi:MAG TPA: hypothetical protein VN025_05890 [Candidatus Dormibacteraeota bacterium]|nr:hypothetical protein [Candidatus Dormibacteraeota bacterium]